ncbi:hypothetical protein ACWFQ8_25330 [Streptomyces sp. NPDC055254]
MGSFTSFKGPKNFTGEYWAATSRAQVGQESWAERDAAVARDLGPAIVGWRLSPSSWPGRTVGENASTPRTTSPGLWMAQVSSWTSVLRTWSAEGFAFTVRVCEAAGWQFRHVGDLDRFYRVDLRRLARYRHRRCFQAPVADELREVFAVLWCVLRVAGRGEMGGGRGQQRKNDLLGRPVIWVFDGVIAGHPATCMSV